MAALVPPLLLLVAGCTHRLRPLGVPRVEILLSRQAFAPSTMVHLVGPTGEEEVPVLNDGIHTYVIDRGEWSRDFIAALETELRRRGVEVDPAGGIVNVSVSLRPRERTATTRVPELEVDVQTGSFRRSYPVAGPDGDSDSDLEAARGSLRDALHLAMRQILDDPEFRRAVVPDDPRATRREPGS